MTDQVTDAEFHAANCSACKAGKPCRTARDLSGN